MTANTRSTKKLVKTAEKKELHKVGGLLDGSAIEVLMHIHVRHSTTMDLLTCDTIRIFSSHCEDPYQPCIV